MGQNITLLYAETCILLSLWNLDTSEYVSKSSFMPSSKSKAYPEALNRLEEDEALLSQQKTKSRKIYALTAFGEQRLAQNLANKELVFTTNIGPKVSNALL